MSSTPQENFTGLQCLQMLLSQTRRNVNFMALISDEVQQEFLKDNNGIITKIADEQQKGTRFYGLQIGHDHTGYEKILDRIWRI